MPAQIQKMRRNRWPTRSLRRGCASRRADPEDRAFFSTANGAMGPEPGFEGEVQASAEDARWLKDWLAPLAPQWAPQAIPIRAVDLSARTNLSPTAIKLRDLVAEIDGAHVTGTLDYRLASGSAPARLDADLATPALDLGETSGFDPHGFVSRIFGASDGSLRLEAGALTLGQSDGGQPAPIGDLNVDLVKTGEKIELNELTFEGQDGAVITASGLLSQQKRPYRRESCRPPRQRARRAARHPRAGTGGGTLAHARRLADADRSQPQRRRGGKGLRLRHHGARRAGNHRRDQHRSGGQRGCQADRGSHDFGARASERQPAAAAPARARGRRRARRRSGARSRSKRMGRSAARRRRRSRRPSVRPA